MTSTTGNNGRLGNQIIRNLAVSLIAEKFNLKVDYFNEQGYDVLNLSLESSELKGVIELEDKSINNIMNLLHYSEFFVGLSSGLSWLAWALNKQVVLISNMTNKEHEFQSNCIRIVNESVCNSCWVDPQFQFDNHKLLQ